MEAIRKQASKLREQVAKQQQAVLKQLGHFGNEAVMIDEDEVQCHDRLQNLYNSTRDAKHFQRNIVRGVEGFISASTKQMEIVRKLAEDCCNYGVENESSNFPLARAALHFGESHSSMEKKRETLLGFLGNQVCEPLRALIKGAPLEDARQLTHRYDQVRQEVDAQAADVLRRRAKSRDSDISVESYTKLQNAEARLVDLKSSMRALGKEATTAMLSVEDQQQQVTFQRLCKMVDAERSYHQSVLDILEKLQAEMILEVQSNEPSLRSMTVNRDVYNPPANKNGSLNGSEVHSDISENSSYFIAQVIHPFDAQADGELSLSVDDYVVVRQVAPNGWSEGECKGNAGWFPSAYVEKQEKAPPTKIMDGSSTP